MRNRPSFPFSQHLPRFSRRTKRLILANTVAGLVVSLAFPSLATTNIFSGGTSTWNLLSNWSLGHVPTSTDGLFFNSSTTANNTLDNSYTAQTLSFDTGSGSFGINANSSGTTARTLTLTGGTNANGGTDLISLSANTTGTMTLGGTAGVGTLTVAFGSTTGTINVANAAGKLVIGTNAQITGTNGLTMNGAGTLQILSSQSYTGITTINGGTLSVSNLANGGTNSSLGASSNAAANLVINGGTLQYTGTGQSTDRLFTVGTAGATLDASGTGTVTFTNTGAVALSGTNTARTLTLTGTGSGSFAPIIGDNGTGQTSLTKNGTGTWTITGVNTFSGVTTINGGVLSVKYLGYELSQGAGIGLGSLVINGGTLQYLGASAFSDFGVLSVPLTVGTAGATLDASSVNQLMRVLSPLTLSGANTARTLTLTGTTSGYLSSTITDNGTGATSLTKNGTGTWTVGSTSTYTGITTINAGTLSVASLANGGTSSPLGASSNAAANLVINGAALQYTGAAQSTDRLFTIGTAGATLDASGTGTVIFTNTGAVALSGTNTTRTLTLTGTGSGSLAPSITNNGTGATSVTKTGTGTWALAGANTYTGSTAVNAGTLQVGDGTTNGSLSPNSSITITAGASLAFNRSDTLTQGVQFPSVITGGGALVQSGTGTLILNGANTQGSTVINAGIVSVTSLPNGGVASPLGNSSNAAANLLLNGGTLLVPSSASTDRLFTVNGTASIDTESVLQFTNTGSAPNSGSLTLTGGGIGLMSPSLTGSGSVIKTGFGTWGFTTAQSYTGNTNVNAGTLEFLGTNFLPSTSNVNIQGGTLALGSFNNVVNNLTLTSGMVDGTGVLSSSNTFNLATGTVTVSLSGTVGMTKTTAGTVTLSGANTYTGATAINAGTLQVGDGNTSGSLSPNSSISMGAGASLIFDRSDTLTQGTDFASVITGGGTLVQAGTGTLILNGANTQSSTLINAGIVDVTSLADGGVASPLGNSSNAAANLFLNGTLQYTGSAAASTDRLFTLGVNGGTIDSSGSGAVTFSNGGAIVFSAPNNSSTLTLTGSTGGVFIPTIGDNGTGTTSLTKSGSGTWTLSGVSTYSGPTNITGGTLQLGMSNALPTSSALQFSGGTLDLNGFSVSVGSISGNGSIINGGAFTIGGNNASTSFSGTISVSTLIKTGTGTFTLHLSAPATYPIVINGGTIEWPIQNSNYISSLILNGGTFLAYQGIAIILGLTLGPNGGTLDTDTGVGSGIIEFETPGGATVGFVGTNTSPTLILQGDNTNANGLFNDVTMLIGNNGLGLTSVVKNGAGTWRLQNSSNTYGGTTTINGGILQVGNQSISSTSSVTISGGTLSLINGNDSVAGVHLINGSITSTTSVLSSASAFDLQSGTVSAILGGTSGLVKSTTGTVTLSGANTYTGATAVSGGKLVVSGSLNGTAGVTVGDGTNPATLSGTGTITPANGGIFAVQNGATLAPDKGTSSGLTINAAPSGTASVNLQSGSTLQLSITNSLGGSHGAPSLNDYSKLTLGTNVTATLSGLIATTVSGTVNNGDVYIIVFSSSAVSGMFSNTGTAAANSAGSTYVFTSGGQQWEINYAWTGNTPLAGEDFGTFAQVTGGTNVALLAIPEPGSLATLLTGSALLLGWRRRSCGRAH